MGVGEDVRRSQLNACFTHIALHGLAGYGVGGGVGNDYSLLAGE